MTGLFTGHCHLKEHLYKLELTDSPGCDTYKHESEMALHVLCDCEVLVT